MEPVVRLPMRGGYTLIHLLRLLSPNQVVGSHLPLWLQPQSRMYRAPGATSSTFVLVGDMP